MQGRRPPVLQHLFTSLSLAGNGIDSKQSSVLVSAPTAGLRAPAGCRGGMIPASSRASDTSAAARSWTPRPTSFHTVISMVSVRPGSPFQIQPDGLESVDSPGQCESVRSWYARTVPDVWLLPPEQEVARWPPAACGSSRAGPMPRTRSPAVPTDSGASAFRRAVPTASGATLQLARSPVCGCYPGC
jgi:hypothetical protein